MDTNIVIPIITGFLCAASYIFGVYMGKRSLKRLILKNIKNIKKIVDDINKPLRD